MRRMLEPVSEINVTNLVDISLTLLIVFMITAPLMRSGVDVALPRTAAVTVQPTEGITVTLTTEKTIYIGEKAVPLAYFRDRLKETLSNHPGMPVFLKADKEIPYGFVVEVVGIIRETGVTELGLVAEPPLRKR